MRQIVWCVLSWLVFIQLFGVAEAQGERESGLLAPYRGSSGPAQRSRANCEARLKKLQVPTPNPHGRIASFVLKAKNKRYAQGGFTGPGALCVEVKHEFQSQPVYGYLLVIYRGGLQVEFPDLNKVVGQGFSEIGDVGTFQSVFLKRANVDVKINDPAPTLGIIERRNGLQE